MNLIPRLIFSIEGLTFLLAFINLSQIKFNKKEVIFAFLVITTITNALFSYVILFRELTALMFYISSIIAMALLFNNKIKMLQLCIFYGTFSSILILLTGNVIGTIYDFILGPVSVEDMWINLLDAASYYLFVFLSTFFSSKYIGNFLHSQIQLFDDASKKKFAVYTLYGNIIAFGLFFLNTFLRDTIENAELLNTIYALTLGSYFLFLVLAIFSFTDSFQKETELRFKETELRHKEAEIRLKDEMLENLHVYTTNVENMAADMRKFRHDHINLLLGFREHLDSNDIVNVRKYFKQYMTTFEESRSLADSRLDVLGNLGISEVKSILSFKFIYAQQLNIDVYVEVPEFIEVIDNDNLVDVCRIIGILVDNAIEAAIEAEKPLIRFMGAIKDGKITLIISNNCVSPPSIHQTSQKGFTTKGEGRGVGLDTVSAILDKNENLLLNTNIKEGMFTQELAILTY